MGELAEVFDVFFNGRPAIRTGAECRIPCKQTLEELVRRGISRVRVDGKVYRIECKEEGK